MKKTDLIEVISKQSRISRVDVKQLIEIILEEISSAITSGKGVEVQVAITLIDKRTRNISLSMKAKDSVEEKAAMKDYNHQSTQSSSSTLGDLLKKAKDK